MDKAYNAERMHVSLQNKAKFETVNLVFKVLVMSHVV